MNKRSSAETGARRNLKLAGLGALVFALLHVVFALRWESWFQPAALDRAWFMGSSRSLITTQVALGVLAAVIAAARSGWRRRLRDAGLLIFGAAATAMALFFAIGPEQLMLGPVDLWPLSLAAAFFLIAPAVVAGTLLGGFLGRNSQRR